MELKTVSVSSLPLVYEVTNIYLQAFQPSSEVPKSILVVLEVSNVPAMLELDPTPRQDCSYDVWKLACELASSRERGTAENAMNVGHGHGPGRARGSAA